MPVRNSLALSTFVALVLLKQLYMELHLSKAFLKQAEEFFERHPPLPFSIFLRKLVLEYIREHIETGLATDFHQHLWALEELFELLDSVEAEIRKG